MKLRWSGRALADLTRLHRFLASKAPVAAADVVIALVDAAERLPDQPRIGQRIQSPTSREVRRIIVGHYEIQYEILGREIYIAGIWHGREDRRR